MDPPIQSSMPSGCADFDSTRLKEISDLIDSIEEPLTEICLSIWRNPELAYKEYFAHDTLSNYLEKEGFVVLRNYHLPTAFRATFQTSAFKPELHRTICFISEYDALPEIGHACGHNLIAISGLASAVAAKRFLENHQDFQGRVICLGTPAEESFGGKIDLLKTDCFHDIDFAFMIHPAGNNIAAPQILGLLECEIQFFGCESHGHFCSDHSSSPHAKDAADAAIGLYTTLTTHRKHLKCGQQISGVIYHADQSFSKSHYYLRTTTVKEMITHKENFLKAVEAAALTSGCRFEHQFAETPFEGLVSNSVLADLYENYGKKLGMIFPSGLPPSYGSTDMGNVSNAIPSIHPFFKVDSARNSVESNKPETSQSCEPLLIHTAAFQVVAGTQVAIKSTLLASKAMTLTAMEVLLNENLAKSARDDFRKT